MRNKSKHLIIHDTNLSVMKCLWNAVMDARKCLVRAITQALPRLEVCLRARNGSATYNTSRRALTPLLNPNQPQFKAFAPLYTLSFELARLLPLL